MKLIDTILKFFKVKNKSAIEKPAIKKCCTTCKYYGEWGCQHPVRNCINQQDAESRWEPKD